MPYGKGGRLGDSIDPRLMQADFSGYANAGMIQGQALAGLGQQIGNVIKQRSDQKKRDAQNEKFLQQALDMFKGTDLEAPIGAAYQEYVSEETTDKQRRAIGETMRETIGLGLKAQEMRMQQAALMAKGGAEPSATSIRAALDLMKASGYNKQAESLEKSLGEAKTPEEMAGVASLIQQMAGSMKYSSLGVDEPGSMAYKISGTPAKVPKGDKMVSEWEVTAPDGSKFTVDAKQKQRLNKAIQSGKPFDLAEVLGEPSMVSRGAGFLQRLFSADEYGTETPKPARPTSLQEKTEMNLQLIELRRLAAEGNEEAAKKAAAMENSLRQGGFMGEMKFTTPEQLLPEKNTGNLFDE